MENKLSTPRLARIAHFLETGGTTIMGGEKGVKTPLLVHAIRV